MSEFVSKITRIGIASAAVALTFFIMHTLVLGGWSFDMLRGRHWATFASLFLSGKILSPKYIAMLFVMAGCAVAGFGLARAALSFAPKMKPKPGPEKEENIAPTPETVAKEVKEEPKPVELYPSMKEPPAPPPHEAAPVISTPPPPQPAPPPPQQPQPAPRTAAAAPPPPQPTPLPDEDKERAALQSKIQEVMERMKAREEAAGGQSQRKPAPAPKAESKVAPKAEPVELPPMPTRLAPVPDVPKTLAPAIGAVPKARQAMNYGTIPPELNEHLERILIGAGFQLLTEIRVGDTGIDYLGIGKNEILVMQVDASTGAFMASEEKVGGRTMWMNDKGSKLSPVGRALAARDDVKRLIGSVAPMPITTAALLAGNSVVNEMEAARDWKKLSVRVMSLSELVKTYPLESVEKVDETVMQKVIPILEAAEAPA